MARREYIETTCKTALNRVRGMPFAWSLNPYRGCAHACHYCYARATHAYLGLNADDDFATKILVKTNFADVLRRELARPGWSREEVALGTATDPYQPCEGSYRVTRRTLAALRDHRTPVGLVTKSTLVWRDADLLAELTRVADATVYCTITTLDPELARLIEPGTPPPAQRLRVVRRLAEAGVRTGVYMAPVLPGLTDTPAAMDALAGAARAHGATIFWASPLRLAPLVREHYLAFIAASFPDLVPRYERAYVTANAPRDYVARIEALVAQTRARHGFNTERRGAAHRPPPPPPPPPPLGPRQDAPRPP